MPLTTTTLALVEEELPELLEFEDWNSTHVTYEPPEVRRLWRQWGEFRIFLHEIRYCDPGEALYHPHPWPSIVKIVDGGYRMGMGFGPGLDPPPIATTAWLPLGTVYEMNHRDGWHYVAPTQLAWSIMVTGKPWVREMPRADRPKQNPLEPFEKARLQNRFRGFYPQRIRKWSQELASQLAELPPFPSGGLHYTATRNGFMDEAPTIHRWSGSGHLDVPGIRKWILEGFTVEVRFPGANRPRFLFRREGDHFRPID